MHGSGQRGVIRDALFWGTSSLAWQLQQLSSNCLGDAEYEQRV